MTYNEVWQQFVKLTPAEQRRFVEAAGQLLRFNNQQLLIGSKVQFKTGQNAFIPGTVIRKKQKNMEVLSLFNRAGLKAGSPVRWTVSPELLIPIPSDQVGMYEFP